MGAQAVARTANKTVRFTRVVERSGHPQAHTLWLPPDKDPEFKRARDTHRLMTLEQTPGGGKADFGVVGYDPKHDAGGQFLIFPKSLKSFEGARVVGVKFDLLEQPKLTPAHAPKRRIRSPAKSRHRPAKLAVPRAIKPLAAAPARPAPLPRTELRSESAPARNESPAHDNDATLKQEIRAAMKELQRGKSVAAYQRLERALKS